MTPTRTCIGCRRTDSPDRMVRLVADGGRVVPGAGLPGRGAWIHPDPDCLTAADRRRAWGRALRVPGVPDTSAVRSTLDAPL